MKPGLKLVLLGDAFTGKTTLTKSFAAQTTGDDYCPTVGSECVSVRLQLNGEMQQVSIRDTAGQERFSSLVPVYCRSADAGIIVYSIVDTNSFQNCQKWVNFLLGSSPDAKVLIFGNKTDLEAERTVTVESLKQFGVDHGCLWWEGCARTGENVQLAFANIIRQCGEKPRPTRAATQELSLDHNKKSAGCRC
jgi:small GTP-binding protein